MKLKHRTQIATKISCGLCKRTIDIAEAILGIIIFSLAFVIIPAIIKMDSKGPVIHERMVLARDDRSFSFYKFRTMVNRADNVLGRWKKGHPHLRREYMRNIKLENDLRGDSYGGGTLGEVSLDELPSSRENEHLIR